MENLALKLRIVRSLGPRRVWTLARQRLAGHRSPFFESHCELFSGSGLELGGPSRLFGAAGYAPAYSSAAALDNVNFASVTRWEGAIEAGRTFRFREGAQPGRQFIHEASALVSIPDAAYDFVLSSHMLEHSANPIKVLHEWKRVMRPGAALLLVLPHKDGTFDRYRPVTSIEHMVRDFESEMSEDDLTHFDEVLRLHDLTRDPHQPSREAFRKWVEDNQANRGVHHHVFDSLTAAQLVDRAGFEILCVEPAPIDSVVVFARLSPETGEIANSAFVDPQAHWLRNSAFVSDRQRAKG